MKLRNLVPMLNISNIERSLGFYMQALNFEVVSDPVLAKEWRWATIRSGETQLMLSETNATLRLSKNVDPHQIANWPTIFYFYPDNVDALHSHVVEQGFKPTAVTITHYGMKEFSIQDPDGHMLSFGEDAESDSNR